MSDTTNTENLPQWVQDLRAEVEGFKQVHKPEVVYWSVYNKLTANAKPSGMGEGEQQLFDSVERKLRNQGKVAVFLKRSPEDKNSGFKFQISNIKQASPMDYSRYGQTNRQPAQMAGANMVRGNYGGFNFMDIFERMIKSEEKLARFTLEQQLLQSQQLLKGYQENPPKPTILEIGATLKGLMDSAAQVAPYLGANGKANQPSTAQMAGGREPHINTKNTSQNPTQQQPTEERDMQEELYKMAGQTSINTMQKMGYQGDELVALIALQDTLLNFNSNKIALMIELTQAVPELTPVLSVLQKNQEKLTAFFSNKMNQRMEVARQQLNKQFQG